MKRVRTIDEKLLEWVEAHRIIIGAALVVTIVAGAITLSALNSRPQPVVQQAVDPAIEEHVAQLREQNELLRKQLDEVAQARVAGEQTQTSSSKRQGTNKSSNFSSQKISGQININTASQAQLESLPRIGPAIAGRIIEYRSANGGFKTIEEIKNVKGIGDKIFEQIRDRITVE